MIALLFSSTEEFSKSRKIYSRMKYNQSYANVCFDHLEYVQQGRGLFVVVPTAQHEHARGKRLISFGSFYPKFLPIGNKN